MSEAIDVSRAGLLVPETLKRLGERPRLAVPGRSTEALGAIKDPEAFFDAEKQRIFEEIGDLSDVRIPLNRILVAIWVRPEKHGSIILTLQTIDEDKWQGVSALVVGMGSHCYEDNPDIAWRDDDRVSIGDWVLFRRGEGFRLRVWGRECVMLNGETAVKMVIPRPDVVF